MVLRSLQCTKKVCNIAKGLFHYYKIYNSLNVKIIKQIFKCSTILPHKISGQNFSFLFNLLNIFCFRLRMYLGPVESKNEK